MKKKDATRTASAFKSLYYGVRIREENGNPQKKKQRE